MNIIIGQSGGPTSVINASLAGVISSAIANDFDNIYLSLHGIEGLIDGQIKKVDKEVFVNNDISQKLMARPSSILGSCRYKLSDDFINDDYEKIFANLRKYNITSFVYIGGNDSMDTVNKLNRYMVEKNISGINVIGCPKTIDNDLEEMDHSPGFGSAAKYIGATMRSLRTDVDIYKIKSVTFVEIMGRHAGWLAASSLLANYSQEKRAVNLVYLPEDKKSLEQITKEIKEALETESNLLVALAEGFRDVDGKLDQDTYSNASDGFGHKVVSGVGERLATYVRNELGIKSRAVELNIVQRTNSLISQTDADEAFELGKRAGTLSIDQTNLIPILKRKSDSPYEVAYTEVASEKIANYESKIPADWLESFETLEEKITAYALPLIEGQVDQAFENGLPVFVGLDEFI